MARRDGFAVLEGRALQLDHVVDKAQAGVWLATFSKPARA
jgi:hypothetical protein